jgi:putative transcription factor
MAQQDWNPVVFHKKEKGGVKKEKDVAQIIQSGGQVETVRKVKGGKNTHTSLENARAIEEEAEDFHVEHVELSLQRKIQQARQDKGWTQKDLAQRINEKAQVVNDYESGRAIPNNAVLAKMERALGVKLRGKPKPNTNA